MESTDKIDVEVAYACPDEQVIIPVAVDADATVEDAICHSGILHSFPDISLEVNKVGIFGKLAKLDAGLKQGDRIEIYRPLIADPKEVRRKRAAEGKATKKVRGKASDQDPE